MPEWKSLVRARLGRLPVDPAREMDIVDELAQHVAEHFKELVASGVGEPQALALAPLATRAAAEIARADRPRPGAPAPPMGGGSIAAARQFWPNQDPIGQHLRWATGFPEYDAAIHTIVGVARDVKSNGLDKPEAPAIYAPFMQRTFTWLRWNSFVARTRGEPMTYARAIREGMTTVDPLQPVYQVASLGDVIAQSVAARRFHTWLIDLSAALGLILCSVGVYGTINYWVGERAREIGVRVALGATRRNIMRMVVGRAAGLTAAGIAIGLALCAAASRALSTFLYDVQPFDPTTIAAAATIVLVTGVVAAYVPARRASQLDPLTVIRSE